MMTLRKTSMRFLALSLLAIFSYLFSTSSLACSSHGTSGGGEIILDYGMENDSGQIKIRLGIETTLVEPATTTSCIAGIGLGSTTTPLPVSIEIVDIQLEVFNALTGRVEPIQAFHWAANNETSAGLASGSGGTATGDPNPAIAGASWFGFSSEVQPFQLDLSENESVRMVFVANMPVSHLPLVTNIQMAAGEGNRDGSPIFSGDHPVSYFTGFDNILLLPLPGLVFANGFED